ncbi:MAG: DUF1622 domain-containing protein [Pseudomonadota bacterium]
MHQINEIIEAIALGADGIGVLVVLTGFSIAVIRFLPTIVSPGNTQTLERIQDIRCQLGTYIVFALELMIVSDLLHSVITREIEDLYFLGGIVVLRTTISYFLNKEIQEITERRASV